MLAQNKCVQADHKIHLTLRQAVSNHQSYQDQSSNRQEKNCRHKWELSIGAMTGTWCVQDQQPYRLSHEILCVLAFANNFHPFLTLKYFQWCCSCQYSEFMSTDRSFPLPALSKKSANIPRNQETSSATMLCPWRVDFPQQLLLWTKRTVCLLLPQLYGFAAHCSPAHIYKCSQLAWKRMHCDGDHLQLQAWERLGKQLRQGLRPLGETSCGRQLAQQFCNQATAETTAQPQQQESAGIIQAEATLSSQATERHFLGYRCVWITQRQTHPALHIQESARLFLLPTHSQRKKSQCKWATPS